MSVYLKLFPSWQKIVRRDGSILFSVRKALYGLAESARLWFIHLVAVLTKFGFVQSKVDKAMLFIRKGDSLVILLILVDDMLVVHNYPAMYKRLVAFLKSHLNGLTEQLGPTLSFLAMTIECSKGSIAVSRKGYIDKVLMEHGVIKESDSPGTMDMLTIKASTPLPEHSLSHLIMELKFLDDVRPDIKFCTSFMTMSMSRPSESLKALAFKVLAYLNRSKSRCMVFSPSSLQIVAYCDASFNVHVDGRSHYGVLLKVGEVNAPFYAKSGVIKAIVRSSTEAEIHALNEAASEILHAVDLMTELGFPQATVPVFEDNQSAIALLTTPDLNFQTRSKHIRVKAFFFQEQLAKKLFRLVYATTENMLTHSPDYATKPMVGSKVSIAADNVLNDVSFNR
jgi:hypothetical protein